MAGASCGGTHVEEGVQPIATETVVQHVEQHQRARVGVERRQGVAMNVSGASRTARTE